jgi:hypothetical protein
MTAITRVEEFKPKAVSVKCPLDFFRGMRNLDTVFLLLCPERAVLPGRFLIFGIWRRFGRGH